MEQIQLQKCMASFHQFLFHSIIITNSSKNYPLNILYNQLLIKMNHQAIIQSIKKRTLAKYTSSETYLHSKYINNIINDKITTPTAVYKDTAVFVEDDEYMKRFYYNTEFKNKIAMFKQYYFYHEDCPRIFSKDVEIIYAKWQDRKRNLVYKKLKHLFNDEDGQYSLTQTEEEAKGVTHFLHELSQYNPFSKKYYLRVQPKKGNNNPEIKMKKNAQSRDQISFLKHDLSNMLREMNELSLISTLDSTRIQSKSKIYHRKALTFAESNSEDHSHSQSKSNLKLSFKKKLEGIQIANANLNGIPNHIVLGGTTKETNYSSRQKFKDVNDIINSNSKGSSPKLNAVENKQGSLQKYKSKSIFAFTSLGQLGQQNNKIRSNSKRDKLKLQFEVNARNGSNEQKKMSMNEMDKKKAISTISLKCNGITKGKSNDKLQIIQIKSKQGSLKKLKTKTDEFCDKKLALIPKCSDPKLLPSYKSQHLQMKKPSFKIKTNADLLLTKKKRTQLKI